VLVLTQAYLRSSTNIENIDELMSILARDGIKLHSPIPKDPSKPCYRLVKSTETVPAILIEETNINDTRYIIASGMDGAIFARRPKN